MNLKERADLVDTVGSALSRGEHTLTVLPDLIRQLLEEGAWREFETRMGKYVTYDRFEDFIVTPPLAGLGTSLNLVKRVVADDPVTLDLLDQALQRPSGGNHHGHDTLDTVYNIHSDSDIERPSGTSTERAIRMLREHRPDLLDRVKSREISPHKAMREAGFRKSRIAINLDSPESAAKTLLTHASPEFLDELRRLLTQEEGE